MAVTYTPILKKFKKNQKSENGLVSKNASTEQKRALTK